MTAAMVNYDPPKPTIKRIHVNQHLIRARDPQPLTVKESSGNTRASRVEILGNDGEVCATLVYAPEHPLSCGARVWIETRNEVRVT